MAEVSIAEQDEDMEFSGKPSSFKEIVMIHLSRIMKLISCELRGGYYTYFKTKSGEEKEVYVQDTRESFSNAVYGMALLLYPKFDKEMKPAFEKFNATHEENRKKFLESTSINETEVLGEAFYNEKDKILLESYKINKLGVYMVLFMELSRLLGRLRYMEIGGAIF